MTLVLAPCARDDLEDLWLVVARGSGAEVADRWVDRIHARCLELLHAPDSGRARPELAPGVRSVVVRPWVVFYRVTADRIEVVRILHARRDAASVL